MGPPTKAQQEKHALSVESRPRRSMRVLLSISIQVAGKNANGEEFQEDTRTLVVNAHGALISLAAIVSIGQDVSITNKSTRESRECRVVYRGNSNGGKMQLGIEFVAPSATFWHVDFPPDDWIVPEN